MSLQTPIETLANEISILRATNDELRRQVKDAGEWTQILMELLEHRERQFLTIKAAIGEEAMPEHPGLARFRRHVATEVAKSEGGPA